MHNQFSIEEAIHKGKLSIVYTMLIFLLVCPVVSIFIFSNYEHEIIHQLWLPIALWIGLIIGFIFMKLYWNYASLKWQFWAFENVRNVHELKRKALENKLISEKNFILVRKFKNRDYERHKKVERIRKNFEEKDIHYDDFSVPKEMEVKIPKANSLIVFIIGVFVVVMAIKSYLDQSVKMYQSLIILALGILLLLSGLLALIDKKPQLILNSNGIKINKKDFISWNEINQIYVEKGQDGNSVTHHLIIKPTMNKDIKFRIDGYDKKPYLIEKAIQIYRTRHKKITS
ncbi:hypothetical protein [Flavobacterium dankookense]|uniref:Uncharacterized protein n=1 Tax=Flavobacterium dankookense TaxID=706186 RepID=A0A4R6QC57_9FLAO|nr:hypothetical protein [Flavobacterium dankookense]TDP59443.1 hypothetical protein BC748_1695 [Flavobacterium dankookense]